MKRFVSTLFLCIIGCIILLLISGIYIYRNVIHFCILDMFKNHFNGFDAFIIFLIMYIFSWIWILNIDSYEGYENEIEKRVRAEHKKENNRLESENNKLEKENNRLEKENYRLDKENTRLYREIIKIELKPKDKLLETLNDRKNDNM